MTVKEPFLCGFCMLLIGYLYEIEGRNGRDIWQRG